MVIVAVLLLCLVRLGVAIKAREFGEAVLIAVIIAIVAALGLAMLLCHGQVLDNVNRQAV